MDLWHTNAPTMAAINDSGTTYIYRSNVEYNTPHAEVEIDQKKRGTTGIHPKLYFTYVKSKMNLIEERNFKARMRKLEELTDEYAGLGQEALSEECMRQFIVLTREAAMYACGLKTYIEEETLEKFKNKVRVPVKITKIANFARPIPKKASEKIKKAIEKKLFDEYYIVHLDNRGATMMTEKEKEKDPICFGKVQHSKRFYFVADWEDEFDDLTMDKIIEKLSLKKEEITLEKQPRFPGKM